MLCVYFQGVTKCLSFPIPCNSNARAVDSSALKREGQFPPTGRQYQTQDVTSQKTAILIL